MEEIFEIAAGLHTAGTFSPRVLAAIVRHASQQPIHHSAETGSGASTLLFSHLSQNHTVFALDNNSGSVANVRRSRWLRPDVVTFVEGPTQQTLPRYRFTEKLQLVLIDGPHAYPFPDIEYYFLYPHLDTGALLILDDIHIRSVNNLFQFLSRDAMFKLIEVVDTTAFFRRTNAPTFDPLADGWWDQRYNERLLMGYVWKEKASRLLNRLALTSRSPVKILSPRHHELVDASGVVEGTATPAPGSHLWVLARRKDLKGWWPQGGGPAHVEATRWKVGINYGEPQDAGFDFEIAAVLVRQPTHELWTEWASQAHQSSTVSPVPLPPLQYIFGAAYRTVKKR